MIRLGDQIIDYSSEFKLILASKESGLVLPPSVASRASIINFTVTSGSLENRALDIALKETRPDVEKERTDLVMLMVNGNYVCRHWRKSCWILLVQLQVKFWIMIT